MVIVISTVVWTFFFFLAHTDAFYTFELPWLNEEFAEAFWPNFIADAGVGILLAWLLGEVLDQASHYDLKLELGIVELSSLEKRIKFHLVNTGQESFKRHEIKYHIFVEDDLGGGSPPNITPTDVTLDGKKYKHYRGTFEESLYLGEKLQIIELGHFELQRRLEATTVIYYYFGTEHGHIPHTVKNGDTLEEQRVYMKTIELELPKDVHPNYLSKS